VRVGKVDLPGFDGIRHPETTTAADSGKKSTAALTVIES
jgi:hypothetical protein